MGLRVDSQHEVRSLVPSTEAVTRVPLTVQRPKADIEVVPSG